MTITTAALPRVIEDHIAAANAGDLDALVATFADDALVTTQLQARGTAAIRRLLTKEFIDDHVTLEALEVTDHHGDFVVRTKYEGTHDKTNLPDPLIMTNYFALRDDKIITLAVIFTRSSA
jgi:ketosteroid isomerase-like protein